MIIFKEIKTKTKFFRQSWTKPLYRLFQVLAQFSFTTSESKLDYCHQKMNGQIPEWLKT